MSILTAYDKAAPIKESWINGSNKRLYSNEIEMKKYFTVLKKFDTELKKTLFYLCLADKPDDNTKWETSIIERGFIKLKLHKFWDVLFPSNVVLDSKTKTILIEDDRESDNSVVIYSIFVENGEHL